MLKLTESTAGETIIEVLLCLGILGMVLGSSYAVASRNIRSARDSQERTQASQFAESITESIQAYAIADQSSVIPNTILFPSFSSTFCVKTDVTSYNNRNDPSAPPYRYKGDPITDPIYCNQSVYKSTVTALYIPNTNPADTTKRYRYTVTIAWYGLASDVENIVRSDYIWVQP